MTTPTPTSLVSLRADERRLKGILWRRVGHQSSYRMNDHSPVWTHGDIYIKATKPRDPPYWICNHCDSAYRTQNSRSTSNFRRHLISSHKFVFGRNTLGIEDEDEEFDNHIIEEEPLRQYSALCTTINGERFRILLLRLFIYCQLLYNLIEHSEFRDLL